VERELSAYDQHPRYEETKLAGKKPFLLTKPPDRESKDIDNVVKMVKKLSNEVVDLKKNVGEGSSKPQTFIHSLRNQTTHHNHLNHHTWIST
jgi:hypothetical protein